jgi:hypothetical protein
MFREREREGETEARRRWRRQERGGFKEERE